MYSRSQVGLWGLDGSSRASITGARPAVDCAWLAPPCIMRESGCDVRMVCVWDQTRNRNTYFVLLWKYGEVARYDLVRYGEVG